MAHLVLSPRSCQQDTVGSASYTIERRRRWLGRCEMTTAEKDHLPLARLESWMRGHIDGFRGALAAEQFAGGQSNPTYKIFSGAGSYVLRRKPLGQLLPRPHAVDREYRVMRALAET